ncbi:thiamine-repressible mitochondrial transport protein Thi74p [Diutina catenulata]
MKSTIANYLKGLIVPPDGLSPRQKWVLGLFNLSLVVVLWVASSFLVNALADDQGYRKPFFLTYINTSLFTLYLLPYLRSENLSVREFGRKVVAAWRPSPSEDDGVPIRRLSADYGSNEDLEALTDAPEEVGFAETVSLSLQFALLWFSANLVTNASLSYTSVASQTILSSTSSFFTLIIGYLYAVERINRQKLMGIILSFMGVMIVTRIDAQDAEHHPSPLVVLGGNLLALSGAVIYGIYTILLKIKTTIPGTKTERQLNTHLFFGCVGVFTAIGLWPALVVLDYVGLEQFELPQTTVVVSLLLGNALITFVSDFCWCKAVLLTSPLTVTVGLSMTIPLAMVGDWIIKGFAINWWYLGGASVVTAGFLIINRDEEADFVE